jgi:hypothetical protein
MIKDRTPQKNHERKNRTKHQKKIYLLFSISLALTVISFACSGTKKTKHNTEMNQTATILTTNFDVSAKARNLIKEIQDELIFQKIFIISYDPSKNIIEKYDIINFKNTYYISGMILSNEIFDNLSLKEIGVKIGNQSGKFTIVQIPINSFELFLKNKGIAYFELTEKVKIN